VRARCSRSRTPEWLYGAFEQLGMHYGPAFRSVTELACGVDEVLARLALPHAAARAGGDFMLHPSVMDGALQASLALYGEQIDGGTAIPFALDRVDVLRPTAREMWAHIRQRPSSGAIRKIDIDLADDSGTICVRLVGFSVRLLPARDRPARSTDVLREAGARFFVQAIAAETAVPASQIALSAPLDAYGIDSFMIVRLTDELEKTFGALPKTLFFEHRTLQAVVDYFVDNHGERLAEVTRTTAALGAARVRDRGLSEEPASTATVDLDAPIAVVGLAGRYPGARDLDGFWGNLVAGRDCITEVPLERWDRGRVSGALSSGAAWGGFIDGIAEFDPLFFNISPREAPFMDPQERLFLQCAHEAIEDSGNTRSGLARGGDVGVFVGVMWEEYQLYGVERTSAGGPLALSSSPASIANRVSSVCDFHGPSLAVDSMCSSSLSAIHLACESLRSGSCAAAIAGGVNLSLHPNKYRALSQGRFLSGSGRCESFGAGGDGYVPSEGVGAAVLKRLDRAIADGDQIYGVIRGSALNHGGKTNGYTVPNPQAQTAVIRRALAKACVAARDISYLEAHGTGTKLGDPIEIAALSAAYRADTSDTGFCRIGSVKSNIGHGESAAGIAGLAKVLLQMRNRQLVPSLHSETLNPGIDFDATPFSVQRRVETWERPAGARGRLAGLSSFGAGGSNAHLILEDHEASPDTAVHAGPFVFPFSARDEGVLENILRRFLAALDGLGDADLASAAFVLQQGREAFEQRVAIVAADCAELRSRLRDALSGDLRHVYKGTCRPGMSPAAELNPRSPDEIARAWADGATIEWARFWRGLRPRKISLPTYPFLREIYWVPGLVPPVGPASDAPTPFKSAGAAALPLLLTPDWQPRAAAPSSDLDSTVRRVVVFCGLAPCPIASAARRTMCCN
jgi:acyl transferase domain-containing protein